MTLKVAQTFHLDSSTNLLIPLYSNRVPAGFPSPADDHIDNKLDLNAHLINNPTATYFVRVTGDSMIGAGINDGDILVVDRSLDAKDGDIVIAELDGELTVKRLGRINSKPHLMPENPSYKPIRINEEANLMIWGVVNYAIHKTR